METRKAQLQAKLDLVIKSCSEPLSNDLHDTHQDFVRTLFAAMPTKLKLGNGDDIFPNIKEKDPSETLTEKVINDRFDRVFKGLNEKLITFLKTKCHQDGFFLSASFVEVAQPYTQDANATWIINSKNFKEKTTTFIIDDDNTVTVTEYFEVWGIRNNEGDEKYSDILLEIGIASSTFKIDNNNSISAKVNGFTVYQLNKGIKEAFPSSADGDVIERYGCTAEQVRAEIAAEQVRAEIAAEQSLQGAINKNPLFETEGTELRQEVKQLLQDKKITSQEAAKIYTLATNLVNNPVNTKNRQACLDHYNALRNRRLLVGGLLLLTAVAIVAATAFAIVATSGAVAIPLVAGLLATAAAKGGVFSALAVLGVASYSASVGFFAKRNDLEALKNLALADKGKQAPVSTEASTPSSPIIS